MPGRFSRRLRSDRSLRSKLHPCGADTGQRVDQEGKPATMEISGPDQISYMDAAAGSPIGLEYKQRFARALDLRTGDRVLDIGCGPGTDLARLAEAVGPDGWVLGIDRASRMAAEASRRFANRRNVVIQAADAGQLPLASSSIDRARTDRVLQHVEDPAEVLAEVRRVLRPGGVLGMVEPDWDTLTVVDDDIRTSREFARFVATRVHNPTIGRELVRLCTRAGFTQHRVEPIPVLYQDFDSADHFLGIRRNCARAVEAGVLDDATLGPWVSRIAVGPVIAGFTLYLVIVQG
jgi:ubiquinone/menaquinone biosynthesis C-methylase UbiE